MDTLFSLPKGAILSRQLPTKGRLKKSDRVQGGYVHEFELREGIACARIRLHMKVEKFSQLHKTLKWVMESLTTESPTQCVEFLLTPASKSAKVTVLGIGVDPPLPGSKASRLRFDDHLTIQSRGQRRHQSKPVPSRRRIAEEQVSAAV